ncbi:hypothetical protein GpSGHVEth098 [Glossina pallidipes salivary gland hypertrophy virus]|uniref:Uncharacterized protein n=1 Tax=Glossina hytrovirus (isolate Glossina pallidipes/Ethiopia/Seibersdorf/-) TaxID=379529 RepID=A0A120HYC2_GHVS|nr:hypothetical protein GpSGHVEth098 [Glossina pallidipes salivary gland hypertrophy virus]
MTTVLNNFEKQSERYLIYMKHFTKNVLPCYDYGMMLNSLIWDEVNDSEKVAAFIRNSFKIKY